MSTPIDLTQYELIREIECTDFSVTYAARCVNNDKIISIKKIDLEKHPYSIAFLNGEMGFWSEMYYPNMVKYFGSIIDKNILYIFTEYFNQGTLLDILQFQYPNGIKDELLISSIVHEILIFLTSFHQAYHIHRSLETKNIFVGQNGSIQVGGFWRARSLIQYGKLQNSRKSKIEPSCYTAPELIIDDTEYHQSVDIWSLGIIAYELAIGKTPYSDKDSIYRVKSIISDPSPSLPNQASLLEFTSKSNSTKNRSSRRSSSINLSCTYNFSPAFHNFILMCLQKDPLKRPSAADLLKHKFLLQAKGTDYIYSNMVAQLPQLSHRFSIGKKSVNTIDIDEPNRFKIDFNFCGMDEKTENNDNIIYNGKKRSIKLQKLSSNNSLDKQKLDIPSQKIVKSRSFSLFQTSPQLLNNSQQPVKVVKKGRFTISVPISNTKNIEIDAND